MDISIKSIVKKIQNTDHKYNYAEIFFDWINSMFYSYANTCNKVEYLDREDKFKRLEEKHGQQTIEIFR
ncbi:hypothetical protein NCTC15132_10145 [Fusobacterium sp. oral taxon C10]